MCGRATVVNPDGITEKLYGFTKKFVPSDWKPRYNLSPHEDIPSVYFDPFLKEKVLRTMHWNLVPSKLESRDKVVAFDSQYSTFNARIETVASAPTFQQAWRSQRCLVVVDGIVEWVGRTKKKRVPHLIRRRDRAPFAMAGLWSRWQGSTEGEELWSCTVIVRDADEWYRQFHDRMAVILSPDSYDEWLDPRKSGQLELLQRSASHSDEELEYYPISPLVNNPRNDSAECLELTQPKEDIELMLDL